MLTTVGQRSHGLVITNVIFYYLPVDNVIVSQSNYLRGNRLISSVSSDTLFTIETVRKINFEN